jgi:catechol 2,3-dioxygenase-like lactoylglutathione lyase family enzyme
MELRRALIFVKDLERMTAFYRDGLGLRLLTETSSEGWVEFEAGGALIALHAIPTEISQKIDIADPPRARSQTPIKLVFETDDLEAACAQLVSQGALMSTLRSWGAYDGIDPEGNVFQIVKKHGHLEGS